MKMVVQNLFKLILPHRLLDSRFSQKKPYKITKKNPKTIKIDNHYSNKLGFKYGRVVE